MYSLNDIALESNKYMKINFDGGGLSSDAGLLLVKEFVCKLGFNKILKSGFKTNDPAMFRIHKDDENLWQMLYQSHGCHPLKGELFPQETGIGYRRLPVWPDIE